MEKKSSGTSNKSNKSDRFIDRILYRFKSNKQSSHAIIQDTQQVVGLQPSPRIRIQSTDEEEYFNDHQYHWNYRRISPEDLKPFCEQLGKFLEYVRNIQELTYFTFDYPYILQSRLEKDANELESIYKEVKAAVISINQITKQRKAIHKDKVVTKKALKKLKDDETREMESILQMYDKTMFQRWDNVKNSHKPDLLENFLVDVKNKQQALENLNTLITRKLSAVHFFIPIPCPDKERSATPGCDKGASGMDDRQAVSTIKRHHQTTNSTLSRYRRRRQDARAQDCNSSTMHFLGTPTFGSDMPLVPFPLPLTSVPSSNHSISSSGSNSGVRSSDSSNNNVAEFHTEMRSVLQALFGDMRQGQSSPPYSTSITINNGRSVNNGNTSTDTNNAHKEIELYMIQRPPQ